MDRIALIGDIHGEFASFRKLLEGVDPNVIVIQVGDFGFWPHLLENWQKIVHLENPVYAIDGNHEYFPILEGIDEPSEIKNGLVYVPRGTVLELGGHEVGFLGGGGSIDRQYRVPGYDWFPQEFTTAEDGERLLSWTDGVDLLVTHVPPQSVVQKHFDLIPGWRDPSSEVVEYVWKELGKPPLVCGHMHRSVVDGNCHVLDEFEPYVFAPALVPEVDRVRAELARLVGENGS